MSFLVINAGSTSLKYALFKKGEELGRGDFEIVAGNYEKAIKQLLRNLDNLQDITAVGHRVVHGGYKFIKPTLISDDVISSIEEFNELAPLHNPHNLACIKIVREYLPDVPHVAVFDTAFFSDLPQPAKIYALPKEITEKYKIYRYGFHGTSHKYVLEESAKLLKTEINKMNLISCHLGGGWSITAVKNGQPIDTSMGLTPLEGLVMMTRAGDIDPGIIFKLLEEMPGEINKEKVAGIYDLLNKQSGIKGLSGVNDFQELLKLVSLGDREANLAFDLSVNRLAKYIGAYWAELEGQAQAIVFTGAIGAGNPMTRNRVMKKIKCLGELPMLAVKADEELMIAREVKQLIR